MKNNEFEEVFKFIKENDPSIEYFGRILGKGSYGQVRDVKIKNISKVLSAKLIFYEDKKDKKDKKEEMDESKLATELRGNNIVKINRASKKEYKNKKYYLIIMEKALLRDLGKLNEFFHNHNLLKLITNPFSEKLGDNLLRFYTIQIIYGFELLDRNYFVHFDIKPENLLMTLNLEVKIADFSLLRKIKDLKSISIPGGTQGFLSPEYFSKDLVSPEVARKQDYFALGSTLFYMKYGKAMFKYQKLEESNLNRDKIIDILQMQMDFIKSRPFTDQDFINFLLKLFKMDPNDRFNLEEIYRNKWLNKNKKFMELLLSANDNDEEKLIMELQKSDFLLKKKKDSNKKMKNFIFKKKEKK